MKIFESPKLKKAMNTILLVFVFYVVAAASFNGFFTKWGFRDSAHGAFSFQDMYEGTGKRPFVHRQLMITAAKKIKPILYNETPELIDAYEKYGTSSYYARSNPAPDYILEYHIVYFMCFWCMLISMFFWRETCIELTKNKMVGTLATLLFAIIFPIFETVGGYFYDFGELLFFSMASFFAVKGWWLALIIISPLAEYNKESFLFFAVTLFPFLMQKFSIKKSVAIIIFSVLLSGLTYLYIQNIYAGNLGGTVEFHLKDHAKHFRHMWRNFEITYGVLMGNGYFLPHVIFVAWIAKNSWKKLPTFWKKHIKIALAVNVPLYLLFCWPGELRNLSLLYLSLIAMMSVYIKNLLADAE